VDPSEQAFSRFFSDEDVERARRMIPQEERVAMFFIANGIELKPAALAREFGISRYKAERLIEKIRQQKFSALKARETRTKPARNPPGSKKA
jgi:DNA-binding transcriptional regulator LsrR (DeoR family)